MASYKLNITNDVMEDEEQGSRNKPKVTTFNEKNYLNVKLRKNEDSKELRIRLLPIDKETGSPFKTIHMHTIAVPKEISENGWKSYVCLKHTDDIDHDTFGSDCPFCEMNHTAYEKMAKAKELMDEAIKNDDEEEANIQKIEVERWKKISLANKESVVCAGELVMRRAAETGAEIVPVDSEHSAIFQCLMGRQKGELKKILLTGSGGPFRGKKRGELEDVTPEQAVRHPNWSMGAKISVDSSTLMNKGLEFVEAMHLFGVRPEDITVVIHPQSVIHSMVELVDGTVIAQLGVPDMGLPIQLALTWPERMPSLFEHLDFWKLRDLSFEEPDLVNFPCLKLAMDCAGRGGTAPCVMSAANEVAVHKFLRRELGYNRIYDAAAGAVEAVGVTAADDLDTILAADAAARAYVREKF